jgi:hypothetical protein
MHAAHGALLLLSLRVPKKMRKIIKGKKRGMSSGARDDAEGMEAAPWGQKSAK